MKVQIRPPKPSIRSIMPGLRLHATYEPRLVKCNYDSISFASCRPFCFGNLLMLSLDKLAARQRTISDDARHFNYALLARFVSFRRVTVQSTVKDGHEHI